MNIKEIYGLARNNIKGRKRIGSIISILFFVTLFVYLLVNSLGDSVDGLVRKTEEMPCARTLIVRDYGEMPEDFLELCENMEHVEEVLVYGDVSADAIGLDEKERQNIRVHSYTGAYEEYIIKGRAPGENEILLPHYMNISTEGNYHDGSQYIGKTITVFVENYNNEEESYTYTVSGTYDNIYAMLGNETMFVSPKAAVEMKKYSYIGGKEYAEKYMEANPGIMYMGTEYIQEYAIVVDKYRNIDKVDNEICKIYEYGASVEQDVSDNELRKVFDVAEIVVVILTTLLLIAVFILMFITIGNDIGNRKKEMAVYMVQGYTRKQLVKILGMEYALGLSPVLLLAIIVTSIIMLVGNILIDKLCTMEIQILDMGMGPFTFFMGVLILVIVLGVSMRTIAGHLNKLELVKEIKSEG